MRQGLFVRSLFLLYPFSPSLQYPSPWCPPSQRYDVHQFPPRCLDCPKITVNPMSVSSISTVIRPRQHVNKFSPGLPQNQTCGCWRAGNQSVIDVSLNASWIVSGLAFHTANRNRWLRRFSVAASSDNQFFLDWGTYVQGNFSVSSAVFFRYPIRATFFRLTILEYVNHMVNASDGFPLRISALVSNSEPFGCKCAALSTGECCPLPNMEVKNNTCVTCMDPSDLHTVVIDGCGRCKPGTQQLGSSSRCIPVIPSNEGKPRNTMNVTAGSTETTSDSNEWVFQVDVEHGKEVLLVLFLTGDDKPLPCTMPSSTSACFAALLQEVTPVLWDLNMHSLDSMVVRDVRQTNPQYLQFDRGRTESHSSFSLWMNESTLRTWARCNETFWCSGFLGALFITPVGDSHRFLVDIVQQPLLFKSGNLNAKSLVCGFSPSLERISSVEIHHYVDTNQYRLRAYPINGSPLSNSSTLQWDDSNERIAIGSNGELERPPPIKWSSMRIFAGGRQFLVSQPVPVVKKNVLASLRFARESSWISIAYGLALKPSPEPGDSEQLVTISAVSKHPMRLVRLASKATGLTKLYTTPKGFISDSRRAMDLVVACNGMMSTGAMTTWLENAIGLLDANFTAFAKSSCERVLSGEVSKLYWLIPMRPIGTGRRERVDISVDVEFA